MLVGIMIGQRTPGHTLAEARAFEERISQRYVDHIARAGCPRHARCPCA